MALVLYPAVSPLHVPAPAPALFHGSSLLHYIRHHHMLQMLAPSLIHVPAPALALFHGRLLLPASAILDLGPLACIMA
jgi:hypothetical protein